MKCLVTNRNEATDRIKISRKTQKTLSRFPNHGVGSDNGVKPIVLSSLPKFEISCFFSGDFVMSSVQNLSCSLVPAMPLSLSSVGRVSFIK